MMKIVYQKRRKRKLHRVALASLIAIGGGIFAVNLMFGSCGTSKCGVVKKAKSPCKRSIANLPGDDAWEPAKTPMRGVSCSDEVAGVWEGRQMIDGYAHTFTLNIKRSADDNLVGNIRSHYWKGSQAASAPSCSATNQQAVVNMFAKGSIQGKSVFFGGESWELANQICGDFYGYHPDRFAGQLDTNTSTIRAKNNDGFNEASDIVFRRIGCAQ